MISSVDGLKSYGKGSVIREISGTQVPEGYQGPAGKESISPGIETASNQKTAAALQWQRRAMQVSAKFACLAKIFRLNRCIFFISILFPLPFWFGTLWNSCTCPAQHQPLNQLFDDLRHTGNFSWFGVSRSFYLLSISVLASCAFGFALDLCGMQERFHNQCELLWTIWSMPILSVLGFIARNPRWIANALSLW